MELAHFDYHLPKELIAQEPLPLRESSRLLAVHRRSGTFEEHSFSDLPALLCEDDLLVFNDSKVFAARLRARRPTGGRVEILLLGPGPSSSWRALVRPGKAVREGEKLQLPDGTGIKVLGREADGISRRIVFPEGSDPFEVAKRVGETPLPPYIRRPASKEDEARYQTVFARKRGSAAAPTAGLHFSQSLLSRLEARGIRLGFVTLHVGPGTFLPLRKNRVEENKLQEEFCVVRRELLEDIEQTRRRGGRVTAVGTTVVRALETAFRRGGLKREFSGWTGLYIYPPYEFAAVDAMVTNFHLPRSSLLVLVCAFGGRELVLSAYREAVKKRFRFYSYGDAMLIL